MKRHCLIKYLSIVVLALLSCFTMHPAATAAGLFGAPQTVSRDDGGLNTAIGYRYHEDVYNDAADIRFRQNEVYSQVAYGAKNTWETYARIGMADLKIEDVFKDNETFFATLGAKAFYPLNDKFGIGAFVQGTYYLNDFNDKISRNRKIEIDHLWDVNCGIGFQMTLPRGTRLYAGPYVYYSETEMSLSSRKATLGYKAGDYSMENKSPAGGFAGLDIPLAKGFRLNVEGQYADRFSAGAAISYTY